MAKKHHPLTSDALCPALEALIGDGGQITLGAVGPVRNAAIAAMPAGMLAALVRRKGETLPQILQRLDAALAVRPGKPRHQRNDRLGISDLNSGGNFVLRQAVRSGQCGPGHSLT